MSGKKTAAAAFLSKAPVEGAELAKAQKAFVNSLNFKKKTDEEVMKLHMEYSVATADAKRDMVNKWLSTGKNMSVFMKEEVQTNQKQTVTDTKGYLMPGQVAEFMAIRLEFFAGDVDEFKVLLGNSQKKTLPCIGMTCPVFPASHSKIRPLGQPKMMGDHPLCLPVPLAGHHC